MGVTGRRKWFERTFALGEPASTMPEVIERLRGTPLRLAERIGGLSAEIAATRHGEAWSIAEHVGHLGDLEPLWLGRVEDLMAGDEVLREADLENTATWEADHNEADLVDLVAAFRDRRRALVSRVEALSDEELGAVGLHPRLRQPMSVVDLCFFVAEHDDHHLATITALGRAAEADG